jgi:hypothetical protein
VPCKDQVTKDALAFGDAPAPTRAGIISTLALTGANLVLEAQARFAGFARVSRQEVIFWRRVIDERAVETELAIPSPYDVHSSGSS